MPWPSELALLLTRTLHLLALTIAPKALSPEPLSPRPLWLWGLGAALALAAILALARLFAVKVGSRLAAIGGAFVWVSVAAALGAALYFRGGHAPLARGVPFLAGPVWIALAVVAAGAAEQWLGASFKHKRMASTILVLGIGATLLLRAAPYLGSRVQLWWAALRRDGRHERAVDELAAPLLKKRKYDELTRFADRCLELHALPQGDAPARPATCACLELRAEVKLRTPGEAELRARAAADALLDAQQARTRCPSRKASRAILAEALALTGQAEAALIEAQTGLDEGEEPARIRYALALALHSAGRLAEGLTEAGRAVDAGGGRDARLLAGQLAILAKDLDAAVRWLEPLVKQEPGDAEARYNLALVAEMRGDYNRAREGYLAALKADPRNAGARYNLALLTFRAGVVEEARHHAKKFQETFPEDPRGQHLARTVGLSTGAAR